MYRPPRQVKRYIIENKRQAEMVDCFEYSEGYVRACNDILNVLKVSEDNILTGLEILTMLCSGKSKEEQETIWSRPPCQYGVVCEDESECRASNFCDMQWTEILFDEYIYRNGTFEVYEGEK
jgi:hypothetical protein